MANRSILSSSTWAIAKRHSSAYTCQLCSEPEDRVAMLEGAREYWQMQTDALTYYHPVRGIYPHRADALIVGRQDEAGERDFCNGLGSSFERRFGEFPSGKDPAGSSGTAGSKTATGGDCGLL